MTPMPSEQPLVSIIIPCWNGEQVIGEAIESALAQSYANTEVVVIDDGSTDGSLERIRNYRPSIRYRSGPNKGASSARNLGISVSRGTVLQFLDADDLLHPRKIELQLSQLVGQQVDSVFCDANVYDLDEGPKNAIVWRHERHRDPVCMALGSNAGTPSGLHRRSIVEKINGFDSRLDCAQDRDFHLRLACAGGRSAVVPEVLVDERRHSRGLSFDHERVVDQYAEIILRAREALEAAGGWNPERAQACARFLAQGAKAYARIGKTEKAMRYERLSRELDSHRAVASVYGKTPGLLARFLGIPNTEKIIGFLRSIKR